MYDYNTTKKPLKLREYGRNIQMMVNELLEIEDREKRNKQSYALINIMKQINPQVDNSSQDYNQKLWDDLYLISGFQLDVDSPYPKPDPKELGKKPEKLNYSSNDIKYRHYGKNIELMLEKIPEMEDEEEQWKAIKHAGKLMKSFYMTYNKDHVEDEVIVRHMEQITGGKLKVDAEKVKNENLFNVSFQKRPGSNGPGGKRKKPNNNQGGGNKKRKKSS